MTKPKRKPKVDQFGLIRNEVYEVSDLFEEIKFLKGLIRQQAHHNKLIAQSGKRIDNLFNTVLDNLNY